jgi:hypothetical protein
MDMLTMPDRFSDWITRLHAWGLNGFAATMLEAAGPLTLLGAQALYAAGPLLTPFVDEDEVTALAHWLEEPRALNSLVERLQKDSFQ